MPTNATTSIPSPARTSLARGRTQAPAPSPRNGPGVQPTTTRGAGGAILDTLPLIILVGGSLALRPLLPAWAAMWAIALVIFFGCKWLTWRREAPARARHHVRHALAYLFAWPGMDPAAFLSVGQAFPPASPGHPAGQTFLPASLGSPRPVGQALLPAAAGPPRFVGQAFLPASVGSPLLRIALGATLLWAVPRTLIDSAPLLAGWAGMAGLVLLLHFGVFDLLALAWRRRGFDAEPLMNAPARSTGLSDFWGNRWNTAFNHLARRYCLAPLRRPLGLPGATLATFLASGLVHDLVISVPARAGYGLPIAYFLIQGVGVLLERAILPPRRTTGSRQAAGAAQGGTTGAEPRMLQRRPRSERDPGLRSFLAAPAAWRRSLRRLYAAAFVLVPLPLLFHAPFVREVMLPFMDAVGGF